MSLNVESKKGSKIELYQEEVIYRNLSSMLATNSHDYPELKLDSSNIFFSGTEDSPEKMTVVSTKIDLRVDYDMIYKDAFQTC